MCKENEIFLKKVDDFSIQWNNILKEFAKNAPTMKLKIDREKRKRIFQEQKNSPLREDWGTNKAIGIKTVSSTERSFTIHQKLNNKSVSIDFEFNLSPNNPFEDEKKYVIVISKNIENKQSQVKRDHYILQNSKRMHKLLTREEEFLVYKGIKEIELNKSAILDEISMSSSIF